MTSFNLNYLLKTPFPKSVIWGVSASTCGNLFYGQFSLKHLPLQYLHKFTLSRVLSSALPCFFIPRTISGQFHLHSWHRLHLYVCESYIFIAVPLVCIQTLSRCFHLNDPQESQIQYDLLLLLPFHLYNQSINHTKEAGSLPQASHFSCPLLPPLHSGL